MTADSPCGSCPKDSDASAASGCAMLMIPAGIPSRSAATQAFVARGEIFSLP